MGMYNTYEGIQLKVGDNSLHNYEVGDRVDIKDGIYVGYGGFVIIVSGLLFSVHKYLTTSWGGKVKASDFVDQYNPLTVVLQKAEKMKKERK